MLLNRTIFHNFRELKVSRLILHPLRYFPRFVKNKGSAKGIDTSDMTLNTTERVFQKSLNDSDNVDDYLNSALYKYVSEALPNF